MYFWHGGLEMMTRTEKVHGKKNQDYNTKIGIQDNQTHTGKINFKYLLKMTFRISSFLIFWSNFAGKSRERKNHSYKMIKAKFQKIRNVIFKRHLKLM